jgi:hypothetical protein
LSLILELLLFVSVVRIIVLNVVFDVSNVDPEAVEQVLEHDLEVLTEVVVIVRREGVRSILIVGFDCVSVGRNA